MHTEKSKKIFVVDDDEFYANMLKDHLSENNLYTVDIFLTGEECVKQLSDNNNPDIIILDYVMNSEFKDAANGLQILDTIRKIDKHVHVIMLSGQEKYGIALQTIAHGAEQYVIKGRDSFAELDAIVKQLH
jgi:CheY-like chemotaxis protein